MTISLLLVMVLASAAFVLLVVVGYVLDNFCRERAARHAGIEEEFPQPDWIRQRSDPETVSRN